MPGKVPIWKRLSAPKDKGDEWREKKRKEYAAEATKRFSRPTCGFFGAPGSLAVGTPYKDPEYALKHPRGGAQFHTMGSGRSQKSLDGALSPIKHVADEYMDPGKQRIAYAKSLKKKQLDRPGFKPAGMIKYKQPVFQAELDASSPPDEVKKLLKALNLRGPKQKREEFEPRGMYTAPPKKGGFGTVGTLIPQYADEAKEMWKYQPSEYDRAEVLRREEAKKNRMKLDGRPPFRSRPTLNGQTTFANNIECYGNSKSEEQQPREKGRHNRLAMEKAKAARESYLARLEAEAANDRPVFKPVSPQKKGVHYDPKMTLSPYPEHVPDPKIDTNPYFTSKSSAKQHAPWVPNNQLTSTPIKSILIGTTEQALSARAIVRQATS